MKELIPIRFKRLPGGDYICSHPGDMSGVYYQAPDAQQLIDDQREVIEVLNRIICEKEIEINRIRRERS